MNLTKMKSINVLGTRYKIKYPNKVMYDGKEYDGICLHTSKIIKVNKHLDEDAKTKTLMHELIHAALRESSADEPLTIEHEEIITECLAKFFFRLFFK